MNFRKRLHSGEQLIGTLLTLGSEDAAEILSQCHFDWLFIDLEHSAMGPAEAQRLLQAIGNRTSTLVRIESRDEVGIRKALDLGATGIIVPQVNSRADAERVVCLSKFPPLGSRSVGLGRATNFGNSFSDYLTRANAESAIVLQIEHAQAVENLAEIAEVKGIDAFFVGPYDLSASYGKPGELTAPEVVSAIKEILAIARSCDIPCGIFAGSSVVARQYLELGFTLIAVASDGILLGRAAEAELKSIRG